MRKLGKSDKSIICQLINASIEEESKASDEYGEILDVMPEDEEFEECIEAVAEIMEDELKHSVMLKRIGKRLGCKTTID